MQMRIPLEHFTATPVFALSPTRMRSAEEKKSGNPSPSGNSASDVFTSAAASSCVGVSSDSHGGQVGELRLSGARRLSEDQGIRKPKRPLCKY